MMDAMDGKTQIDQTARREGESLGVWLSRLVVLAQPSAAAFANLRDAARPRRVNETDSDPVKGMAALAGEVAAMRTHQAVGQFRACAHAAWIYLDALDELLDDACGSDKGYERWGGE